MCSVIRLIFGTSKSLVHHWFEFNITLDIKYVLLPCSSLAHSLSQTILSPFRQALIITTKGLDHNLPRTKLFDVATSHLFPVQSLQNGNIHLLKRWGSKIDETTSLRKFSCSSTSVVFPVGCCLKGSHSNNYSSRKIINDSLHLIYLLECRRREKDQTEILRKTKTKFKLIHKQILTSLLGEMPFFLFLWRGI